MKYLVLLLKLALTVFLVYFAVKELDFSSAKEALYSTEGLLVLVACTLIVIFQTVLAGYRLKPILELFSYKISAGTGISLWFLGNFFSQIMISFLGGDTMRVIALVRSSIPSGVALRAIFLDRVLGFVSIQILFLSSLPFLLKLMQPGALYWGIIALAVVSASMIIGFLTMGFTPHRYTKIKYIGKILDIGSISRYLFVSKRDSIKILILSCFVQFCNIYAIYFITNTLGGNISLFHAYSIGCTVMLLAMLPISIGGWGVRESSMVVGFGLIGISSDIALTVSVIIGFAFLIGSLPGAFVLFGKYKGIEISSVGPELGQEIS